jgi:UDP-4-amino-4,6-dideoxy-N-acetyl-beta-L-altrosamine N-acetyltransferase
VVVVMGRHAPWIEDVREAAKALPWPCEVKVDATNIAQLLADCDLAIGAAGGSAWERCALGVPSLVVVTAHNQEAVAKSLEKAGAVRLVGDIESIAQAMPPMLQAIGSKQLADMSRAASEICDGQGTRRVTDTMRTWGVEVRGMREADLETVLQWRNHPDIRRWMYSSHEISPSEHREWYTRSQEDRRRHLLMVQEAGVPFGFVQFTETGNDGVADWGFYTAPGSSRGSGRKLGLAALDYAFTRIGLRKVCGEAAVFNRRSTAFHRKLGFADEGMLRTRFFDGTTYHDVLRFGLEASAWHERH